MLSISHGTNASFSPKFMSIWLMMATIILKLSKYSWLVEFEPWYNMYILFLPRIVCGLVYVDLLIGMSHSLYNIESLHFIKRPLFFRPWDSTFFSHFSQTLSPYDKIWFIGVLIDRFGSLYVVMNCFFLYPNYHPARLLFFSSVYHHLDFIPNLYIHVLYVSTI